MALGARYDGIKSKLLRHAFAMQEIEGSPATDEEIELYRRMEDKEWASERQVRFVRNLIFRQLRYRSK